MGLLSIPIFFMLGLILLAILFPGFMRAVFLIIGGVIVFAIIASQFEPRHTSEPPCRARAPNGDCTIFGSPEDATTR
jgi:hypothetical protein